MSNFQIAGLLGTDDDGFAIVDIAASEQPRGISPAAALEAVKKEDAGYISRQPFRMFADFTGCDPRFRDTSKPNVVAQGIDDWFANGGSEPVKKLTAYPDGNPKTAQGMKKPDLSVVPASALLHLATAMMNGSEKYGPYNYRDDPVSARTYVAAGLRHLLSYLDGEDFSQDTVEAGKPVHHLAHVMACCAILLDTTEVGTLLDNRPNVAGKTGDMIERFNKTSTLKVA